MKKPRILLTGEFSGFNSGISILQKAILDRLYKSGRFEVAELPMGMQAGDPKIGTVPWQVFPALPHPQDEVARKQIEAFPFGGIDGASRGAWIWENIINRWRPHIVFCPTDPWFQLDYIAYSPLRRFYKIAFHAAVDGFPQNVEWVDLYNRCDKLFTYSDWGASVIKDCIPGSNVESARLCIDTENIKPLDKMKVRDHLGIRNDAIIFGMNSRNQPRKDFDSLMRAFKKYLEDAPSDIANRSYLYMHTSYPDISWQYEEMVHEHSLSAKILFTYKCGNPNCGAFYPAFFLDAGNICRACKTPSLTMTGPATGISREQLNLIYNLWDACIHISWMSGYEFGVAEAIMAGVPTACVDYSGTEDFKNTANAIPLKVAGFRRETGDVGGKTGRYWGIVDIDDVANRMRKLAIMPSQMRQSLGMQMRHKAQQSYNWDNTVDIIARYFESVDTDELDSRWRQPSEVLHPVTEIPNFQGVSPSDIVNWCITNIAREPDLLNSIKATELIRNLTNGAVHMHGKANPFNINNVINFCMYRRSFINGWEAQRVKTNV